MTLSHRPSHPALALVLLATLLGSEWGHTSIRPSAQASWILGNIHPPQPASTLSPQREAEQEQGRTHVLPG